MRLKKEGRTLTLTVDSDPSERRKGPKKMNIGNSVYFGGLPDNNLLAPDNFVSVLSFLFCSLLFHATAVFGGHIIDSMLYFIFIGPAVRTFPRLYEKSHSEFHT